MSLRRKRSGYVRSAKVHIHVIADNYLESDYNENITRRLEKAIVIPAPIGCLEGCADPIVFSQEQGVEHNDPIVDVAPRQAGSEELEASIISEFVKMDSLPVRHTWW